MVTSARRSGTRQQSCGRTSQAMRSISSVTAISRFMRVCSRPRSARTSRVLDVAAVLAQVQRDVVGAGLFGEQRGVHRVGIARAARAWRSVAT